MLLRLLFHPVTLLVLLALAILWARSRRVRITIHRTPTSQEWLMIGLIVRMAFGLVARLRRRL